MSGFPESEGARLGMGGKVYAGELRVYVGTEK